MENVSVLFRKRFDYYKKLGEDTMIQLSDEELFWQPNPESNSVAVIVQHIAGSFRAGPIFLQKTVKKPGATEIRNSFRVLIADNKLWSIGIKAGKHSIVHCYR